MVAIKGKPRVAITGFGQCSALPNIDEAFTCLSLGKALASQVPIDNSSVCCVGVPHSIETPLSYLSQRKWLKYMGGPTRLAVQASGHALTNAGLLVDERASVSVREAMGLFMAVGPIAFDLDEVLPGLCASRASDGSFSFAVSGVAGLRATPPMMPFHTLLNMPLGLVSMIFGIRGKNGVFYPDTEQALFAIAEATRSIQVGRLSSALVGGTAELLSAMPLVGYQRSGWVAASAAAAVPFGESHAGLALTNAAAMIVLESEEQARQRNAEVLGWIDVDAMTLSAPEIKGAAEARDADADATIVTGTIDCEQDRAALAAIVRGHHLSLDAILGHAACTSLPLAIGAATRMLNVPTLFNAGKWGECRRVSILCAHNSVTDCRWSRMHVERAT